MGLHPIRVVPAFVLGLVGVALAGCGPRVVERETTDHGGDNLFALSKIYSAAQRKLGRPPRNAEELRPFAKDVGDLDQLLVSPNDRQPYVIAWGTDLNNAPDPLTVVVYEKAGAGGVRYALTPTGVAKLTADQFSKAHFPSGHRPGGP